MNKIFKIALYVLIAILVLTVLIALVLSFIPRFAPSSGALFKVTDFIYLPIPLIGILIMILVIDRRSRVEAAKKDGNF